MYEDLIISKLEEECDVSKEHAQAVIDMLDEGNTIPFIARYRKEKTGSMSDETLRNFYEKYTYLVNFYDRLNTISNSITEQGKMTDEINKALFSAKTLSELEDIYRPYKPKKKTRAIIAKEKGLEPLADFILSQDESKSIKEYAKEFINEEKKVLTVEEAIQGAKDIIAEIFSDSAKIRKLIRNNTFKKGLIVTKKDGEDERGTYQMYYDYSENIARIVSHRILAINRGEKEKILKVTISSPDDENKNYISKTYVKSKGEYKELLDEVIDDSYKRLIMPSIENEIRTDLFSMAENTSIEVFKSNLKELLLCAPTHNKVILGFDPGIRTGCKIAIVDQTGKVLYHEVLFATINDEKRLKVEAMKLAKMIIDYKVDLISLGNGTASRESERFIRDLVFKLYPQAKVDYVITNEAGASVYSASKLATEELPDLDVSYRGAVSMARRVQDPLAELVKIDPKSIGVGQYQHDMNQKHLSEALGGVVESCVNTVGVDLNVASPSLLSYVAGINNTIAKNIVSYREANGEFKSRQELLKVSKLGNKAFEQCAGFLRIRDADPLDNTGIHPESYDTASKLLSILNIEKKDIGTQKCVDALNSSINVEQLAVKLNVGIETLLDIIEELKKPGRDIRDLNVQAKLDNDVIDIADLKEGMILNGTVRNIIDFGAFVDIGVHQDGLVHISQISSKYIKHPLDVLKIGDIVKVKVISLDIAKKRIGLSIKEANQ